MRLLSEVLAEAQTSPKREVGTVFVHDSRPAYMIAEGAPDTRAILPGYFDDESIFGSGIVYEAPRLIVDSMGGQRVFGTWTRSLAKSSGAGHPICPDLVDLRITGAEYNREYSQLNVTVQNASDIELNNRDVEMFMVLNEGGGLRPAAWSGVRLDPWGTTDIVWPVSYITPVIREGMLGGYTLTVDPRNQIAEEEEDNNSFTVAGQKLVQVDWWSYRPPFVMESQRHRSRAHLTIDIQGGVASERILDVWTPELRYTPEYFDNVPIFVPQSTEDYLPYSTGFIEISGDENIVLNFSAEMEFGGQDINLGRVRGLLNVGVENLFRPQLGSQPCSGREEGDGSYTFTVYPRSNYGTLGLAHTPYWAATVHLCSIE